MFALVAVLSLLASSAGAAVARYRATAQPEAPSPDAPSPDAPPGDAPPGDALNDEADGALTEDALSEADHQRLAET